MIPNFTFSSSVQSKTGNGCASVFNTYLSRGKRASSEKSRYRYLSVSAKKKLVVCP